MVRISETGVASLFATIPNLPLLQYNIGDVLTYTVTYTNSSTIPLTNVTITDVLASGLTFLPGSVTINGGSFPLADIEAGINTFTLAPGATTTVTFKATITSLPPINPVPNTATVAYDNGVPVSSNTVTTLVFEPSRGVLFI